MVNGCRAFVPRMKAQQTECHIVNTSSLAGLVAMRVLRNGLYTASKYAATGFTEMLRSELAPDRIGVSLLVPGRVQGHLRVNTARNRPPEYGGPREQPGPPNAAAATRPAVTLAQGEDDENIEWDADDAGALLVEGVRRNWAYICTNPRFTRRIVEHRFGRLMRDAEQAERFQDEVLLPRMRARARGQ
jgi:NAD(P)-dependent dehydrogenase (short-subunit alcohol dehydrogenase family)